MMKNQYVTKSKKIMLTAFFSALFCVSMMAQVQYDKLRVVPTVEGDTDTEFLIVSHATDTFFRHPLFVERGNFLSDDAPLEYTQANDYHEYQILSPTGGKFAVILQLASQNNPGEVNVSVYKTETELWSETGPTINANTGGWSNWKECYYEIGDLEAGVVYNLRITHHHGVNLKAGGISVKEIIGSPDASLSAIKINGETIPNFDPEVLTYTIPMPAEQWVESFEVITNNENATVEVPAEIPYPVENYTTAVNIKVTAESGNTRTYELFIGAPIAVSDGISLTMADDIFFNFRVGANNSKMNSFGNGEYVDYYIYSEFDMNLIFKCNIINGYGGSNSYLNVSTIGVNDTAWTPNEANSKHIPITYLEDGTTTTWDPIYAKDYEYVISLKEYEPMILRLYGITNKGTACDIFSMTFEEIDGSIDATLSDLKINGVTVEGFDPNIKSYNVDLPVGSSTATIAATANDVNAQGIEGIGAIEIEGLVSSDTIIVTSESGVTNQYILNFNSPFEITFDNDNFPVLMNDWMYYNSGVRATNLLLNYFRDEMYVEYYIYSATDKDMHLVANVACGIPDTLSAALNFSTYGVGEEWVYDETNTVPVPILEEGMWSIEFATELKYNLSLKANEPVKLRIYGVTDSIAAGDIFSLTFVDGFVDGLAVESTEASELSVWGGNSSLNVRCNDSFVGGTVSIYNLSGKLISTEQITSSNNVYDVKHGGLYIVSVMGRNNLVQTTKCIVK